MLKMKKNPVLFGMNNTGCKLVIMLFNLLLKPVK